jgi:PAS domain S-box-containing protein
VEALISNMIADPDVGAVVMSVRDVSDRIRVIGGRRSEDRYRGLLEQSPEAVLVIDRDLSITYASWMARRLLGARSAGALLGQPFRRFLPEEDAVSVERAIRGVLRADAVSRKAEWTVVRLDGRRVDVELASAAVVHAGHKAVQIVLRDVTAGRRAELRAAQAKDELERYAQEMQESNRELESFGAIALHDITQPMQVAYGYLMMLQDGKASSTEEVREWSGHAVRTLQRMHALVESLAVRSSANKSGLRAETVDCGSLIVDVIADLAPAIGAAHARVDLDALPELEADPVQLSQLFQNLLANGLKFVRAGERPLLRVSASRDDGAWRFVVVDNGIGIPADSLEQVFEPFERVSDGTRYPGSGLGLYTCRRIVERHGGRIWAERGDPLGTRICFTVADPAEPRRTAARG